MSLSVCLSVCLSTHITRKPHGPTPNFVHVAYGRRPVLLWRRYDTLCTSGFADDVMFSRTGSTARSGYSQAAIEYNSRDSDQILLNDT